MLLGGRDPDRARAAAEKAGARPLLVDVTDAASVRAAADQVARETGRLDVLINNAGIIGPLGAGITAADMQTTYDTNVFGAVRMMHAFAPLLDNSAAPVVVNVSSGLGSIALASNPELRAARVPTWIPAPAYGSSKAALNMATVQYAHAYPRMRINAVDPGHTATDFNHHTGPQPVEEGAEIIVRMAVTGSEGPTGGFFAADGPMPW